MAGRPPKMTDLVEGKHLTKEQVAARQSVEQLFGGEFSGKLKPSNHLNASQKKIFKFILEHIKHVGFLGDVDVIMLENTCIAIDRLQQIEKILNEDFDRIRDRELMAAKSKYQADLQKGVDLFGLAPASRAKFGAVVANNKEKEQDPLLKILKGKSG